MIEEHAVVVTNTLEEERYNLTNINLEYIVPKTNSIPSPTKQESITIATDQPKNNKNFSLAGQREEGNLDFTAKTVFDPSASNADRSDGSLQVLLNELDASAVSGSTDLANQLRARFGQDDSNNYIVRTIVEQRVWVREYINNPGLDSDYALFGGAYDFRTVDGSNNNTGTPIDIQEADIDRNENNPAKGKGIIRFKVGGTI